MLQFLKTGCHVAKGQQRENPDHMSPAHISRASCGGTKQRLGQKAILISLVCLTLSCRPHLETAHRDAARCWLDGAHRPHPHVRCTVVSASCQERSTPAPGAACQHKRVSLRNRNFGTCFMCCSPPSLQRCCGCRGGRGRRELWRLIPGTQHNRVCA